MGHEAQRRMMASSAVLVGLSGLGAEVAKNVVLAGLHQLTLVDPQPATDYDLGGNFYLPTSSSSSRAGLSSGSGRTHSVPVIARTVPDLSAAALVPLAANATVLVVTLPLPEPVLVAINDACRAAGTCFIYAVTMSGAFPRALKNVSPGRASRARNCSAAIFASCCTTFQKIRSRQMAPRFGRAVSLVPSHSRLIRMPWMKSRVCAITWTLLWRRPTCVLKCTGSRVAPTKSISATRWRT